jgi:hypothetical protein
MKKPIDVEKIQREEKEKQRKQKLKPRFVPPHASQPDGKPQPSWPEKKDREQ